MRVVALVASGRVPLPFLRAIVTGRAQTINIGTHNFMDASRVAKAADDPVTQARLDACVFKGRGQKPRDRKMGGGADVLDEPGGLERTLRRADGESNGQPARCKILLRLRQVGPIQIEILLLDHLDLGEIFLERLEEIGGFADDHQAGRLGEIFLAKSVTASVVTASIDGIYLSSVSRGKIVSGELRDLVNGNLHSSRGCERNRPISTALRACNSAPLTGSADHAALTPP